MSRKFKIFPEWLQPGPWLPEQEERQATVMPVFAVKELLTGSGGTNSVP
jgi:hypothetical protein